jgi:hypothetical protein
MRRNRLSAFRTCNLLLTDCNSRFLIQSPSQEMNFNSFRAERRARTVGKSELHPWIFPAFIPIWEVQVSFRRDSFSASQVGGKCPLILLNFNPPIFNRDSSNDRRKARNCFNHDTRKSALWPSNSRSIILSVVAGSKSFTRNPFHVLTSIISMISFLHPIMHRSQLHVPNFDGLRLDTNARALSGYRS